MAAALRSVLDGSENIGKPDEDRRLLARCPPERPQHEWRRSASDPQRIAGLRERPAPLRNVLINLAVAALMTRCSMPRARAVHQRTV